MTTTSIKHRENADALLAHAYEMAEKGDRLQASEKIWGAVAQTLKEIAAKHRWKHDSHADLGYIADYLVAVTGDRQLDEGFGIANGFHRNFYEDEYSLERIERGVLIAEDTIERLRAAEAKVDAGARPSNGAKTPLLYVRMKEAQKRELAPAPIDTRGRRRQRTRGPRQR